MNVLVINAGSSSLKYQLVHVENHAVIAKGICERVGSANAFHKHGIDENEVVIDAQMADHDAAMGARTGLAYQQRRRPHQIPR